MKLKQSLIGKFTLVISSLFLAFFLVMILALQLISELLIVKIKDNIYIQQEKVDETVRSIVYEAISVHSRMFTIENINLLMDETQTNKNDLFITMSQESQINNEFYDGVVSIIDDEVYKSNQKLTIPSSTQVNTVLNSSNWIEFCGTISNDEQKYVLLGKKIIDTTQNLYTVGTAFYYLKEEVLSNLNSLVVSSTSSTFLVNNGNYVFSHSDKELVGSTIFDTELYDFTNTPSNRVVKINNDKMIAIINSLSDTNYSFNTKWSIVTLIPYNVIYQSINGLRLLILAITISMLIIAIFVTIKLTKGLLKPINTLSKNLTNFTYNESKSIDPKNENDELYQLEKTYDDMIERIYNLMEKNREDMETQRKLELDSLQMQINPHFLYNTLDAIAWMSKLKKQPEIEKLVLSLAKFFRISLHKGDKYITVNEEVELIQHFIEIELFRFPNKFEMSYDISEEVKNYQTLKLILQPIVENAIKHGISPITKMGHIEIRAYIDNDDIVYEVNDDGIGFEPPSDILIKTKAKQLQKGGYGLINVNERIKLEYGEKYGLKIESHIGGGTKVTVRIAKRI